MNNISFPGLGLSFDISPVAFNLFGKDIYWYGIIIASALLVCIAWALKDAPRFSISQDTISDLVIVAVPLAIIGARIYYVAFNWGEYSTDIWEIFAIWNGGIAIYGAIIGSVIGAYIFARVKKISALKLFDFCVPYLALGQAIGRWGNFFNCEAYGSSTALPWGMKIVEANGAIIGPVHPTFFYESLLTISIFIILMVIREKTQRTGQVFLTYMLLYPLGRFFIEGLRMDSLMFFGLRVSQLLSLILALTAVCLLFLNRTRKPKKM